MELTGLYTEIRAIEACRALMTPHIKASGGLLEPIPINLMPGSGQALNCHKVDGSPQPPEVIEAIASGADPRFPEHVDELRDPEGQSAIMDEIGAYIDQGYNVFFVTSHGDITDMAFVMASEQVVLKVKGHAFKAATIVSKAVPCLGAKLDPTQPAVPVVDVLGMECDEILLSWPQSSSMRSSDIPSIVGRHNMASTNSRVQATIDELAEAPEPLVLTFAGSGTTEKPVPGRPGTYAMGELGAGTARMMARPNTVVVPVALHMHDRTKPLTMRFCKPREVPDTEAAEQVMYDIRDELNLHVPDQNFLYGPEGAAALGAVASQAT